MNPDELSKHFNGRLAVLSALGQPGFHMKALTFYQDSIKSLVTAMRTANIKRLICMTSMYTKCKRKEFNVFSTIKIDRLSLIQINLKNIHFSIECLFVR